MKTVEAILTLTNRIRVLSTLLKNLLHRPNIIIYSVKAQVFHLWMQNQNSQNSWTKTLPSCLYNSQTTTATTPAFQNFNLPKAHFSLTVQKNLDPKKRHRQFYRSISTLSNWIVKKHRIKVCRPSIMPKTPTKVSILTTCTLLVSFATKRTNFHVNTPPPRFRNLPVRTRAKKF